MKSGRPPIPAADRRQPVTIWLRPDEVAALRALAAQLGTKPGEVIGRILRGEIE